MIVTDSLAWLEKRGEEFLLQCARGGGDFLDHFISPVKMRKSTQGATGLSRGLLN